jgi:16S rRNA (cytidine1402-2'-O)-methyltransferase
MINAELYVVATPLGNLKDITLRAIECLNATTHFFAEDTRESMKLLELCGISLQGKKFHSYASHNLKKATELAVRILLEGHSVALLSDRGTPGISDPGALLVRAAREAGVAARPLPGPSAVTALYSVSGLSDSGFLFVGFLPKENKPRQALFKKVASLSLPVCFYESPRRVRETFQDLKSAFPKGSIFFGREMTKLYEEFGWLDLQSASPESLNEQGEYVCILQPGETRHTEEWEDEVRLRAAPDKEWAKAIAEKYGVASSDVYNALQATKKGSVR